MMITVQAQVHRPILDSEGEQCTREEHTSDIFVFVAICS